MCTEHGVKPKKESKKYSSIEDLNHALDGDYHWWEWIEIYWHRYIWFPLSDIPRNIKSFFQRGIRGYADSDVWSMHYYLSKVILNMLIDLKKNKHGYPATWDHDKKKWDYNEKRWDNILDEMIAGFAIIRKCEEGNDDIEYGAHLSQKEKRRIESAMQEKYPKWRYTTKEEEDRIKKAFDLFYTYYHGLWD
jgi:hypothetical protein